jgi:hypothetical protein
MKKNIISVVLIIMGSVVTYASGKPGKIFTDDSLKFYDGQQFIIIGKFHDEKNYLRFPQRYKPVVREQVWGESLSAAGISIRFRSNASTIVVRWSLTENHKLRNLNPAGADGVDLYAYTNNHWQYVNTGLPKDTINESKLLRNGEAIYQEYLLNLPLYNGVSSVSIGIDAHADISIPVEKYLIGKKPVVYYGSSIAQGASASRPGLAFTNILSRKLDRSFINMGFSGEGTFDESVGQAMSEIDAALYAIDCTPNSKKEIIYDRAVQLVKLLKEKRPLVPVLLIEGFFYDDNYFNKDGKSDIEAKRKELQRAYDTLRKSGIGGLYYKKGDGLIGEDHEATVDGVHPDDIGMERFAAQMLPVIKSIIANKNVHDSAQQ